MIRALIGRLPMPPGHCSHYGHRAEACRAPTACALCGGSGHTANRCPWRPGLAVATESEALAWTLQRQAATVATPALPDSGNPAGSAAPTNLESIHP